MAKFSELPGHLIRRLQQISVAVFTDLTQAAGFDLTPVQFAALSAVRDHPGIDQATLAGTIAYDRVTIGGVVDRLVAKGFVSRVVNPEDRRARVLHATDEGINVLVEIEPVILKAQTVMLAGLDEEEREHLTRLLAKATATGNAMSRAPLING